jgi:sulfonate transport system substrate-binding protein
MKMRINFGQRGNSHFVPIVLVGGLLLLGLFYSLRNLRDSQDSTDLKPVKKLLKLRLSRTSEPVNWLTLIAWKRGIFKQAGLEIEMVEFPSGKRALRDGLFSGRIDVATVAETPFVVDAFKRHDLRLFASIGSSRNVGKIAARLDRGIMGPEDLRGKRIATQKGSAVHYFLSLLLLKQRIPESAVQLSYLKAEKLAPALRDGSIDAFSMREPFISEAHKLLKDNFIELQAPGLYLKSFTLICLAPFAKAHPETLERLVQAYLWAEEFLRSRHIESVVTLKNILGLAPEEIESVLKNLDLRVSLSQTLLQSLLGEGRWASQLGLTDAKKLPNFLSLMDFDPLHKIQSKRITVIR